MITPRQIQAARVLLGWDASDLAAKAELSRETISKIENNHVQPHGKSLAAIFRVFNEHGIQFIDTSGVRLKPQNVETLEGSAGFLAFYDNVYEYLRDHGGRVCVSGVNERLYSKSRLDGGADPEQHRKRMAQLTKSRGDIKVQILVKEGDYNFAASQYAEYKWQPAKDFSNASFYVYGDTLALISFAHEPAPLIILIRSAVFAHAYRQSFDIAWANAIRIPHTKKTSSK
jgi:DNA-binding XRE family transcriptional regulator